MPKLHLESNDGPIGTFDVPVGKRLINAIEDATAGTGIDQLHSCGGLGRCTTCRVEFSQGEPTQSTETEKAKLAEKGLTGVRLSCQIVCDHDMSLKVISRLAGSGKKDVGPRPKDAIEPPAVWVR